MEHPIGCVSCHVYPERDGLLANMLNEDYLSPLNAAVSEDGSRLYVIAQDADLLIEVDLNSREVLSNTKVGRRPHSAILTRETIRRVIKFIIGIEAQVVADIQIEQSVVVIIQPYRADTAFGTTLYGAISRS